LTCCLMFCHCNWSLKHFSYSLSINFIAYCSCLMD
jgi:hypothetical protein